MATKMPRAVVDLNDFSESVNIMVYGDTGSGKTELVGHLPGKVLVISSENGTLVIKRMMKRLGWAAKEAARFKVWPIRSFQDMEDAYIWCRDNPGVFDWYAIDSATSVQQRSMRAAMEQAVKRNPEKRDVDLPDRGEHQKMQNSMKRMIVDFNELPTNVLWLAQAMRREDQDGTEIVVPFIMGKDYEVSAFACAQMSAFGYYMKKPTKGTKGSTDRVLIWDSFADKDSGINYWSKDRFSVFPKVCLMASGDAQKMMFTDLLDLIDSDAAAVAKEAVETRDDDGEEEPVEDESMAEADDEQDSEATEEQARTEELLVMKPAGLALQLKAAGLRIIDFKGKPVREIVDAILEAEFPADEPEPEDEPAEADSEDGEISEEEQAFNERRDWLLTCKPLELKKAVEEADMAVADFKGVERADIVDAILDIEFPVDGGEDSDDTESDDDDVDLESMLPDDEDEDEDEPEPEPAPPVAKRAAVKKTAAKKATATTRRFRANEED